MSTTFTPNVGLGKPAISDTGWGVVIDRCLDTLDALSPVGGLAVTAKENPSTTLNVKVAAGSYIKRDYSVGTYAGTASQAIPTASTKVLYLDATAAYALTIAAAYPGTQHVRLATVVTGATTITSVTDNRLGAPGVVVGT